MKKVFSQLIISVILVSTLFVVPPVLSDDSLVEVGNDDVITPLRDPEHVGV